MLSQTLWGRLCAALLVAACFACAPAAPAQTPPDTLAVSGSPRVSGLALAPEAQPAPDAVLHLSLALKSARIGGVDAFIASQHDPKSLNFHRPLTPAQFGERFGASDADIAAVTRWAQAQGMTVRVWPGKLFVSANAPVRVAEAAFGVRIVGFQRAANDPMRVQSASFYAPDRAPRLPVGIATRLHAVFGLDNALVEQPAFRGDLRRSPLVNALVPRAPLQDAPGDSPTFSSAMTPNNLSTFYEFDPLHTAGFRGEGQTIAVYSPSGFNTSDLAAFAAQYGRTGYTLNVINVDGGNTDLTNQLEPALDTEVIIGQARYATINLYQFPNNGASSINALNQMATDNPPVLSISWGATEQNLHASSGGDSRVYSEHAIFSQMAAQGMSVFASTGDNGASVSTDGTLVNFPASDPYVTAVGGTDNLADSSSVFVSEQGWTGSGGGRSIYFTTPSYQTGPGVSNAYSNNSRQLPDVSAAGGPSPAYSVYGGGGFGNIYGTSASTPLWAVATVLLNQGLASQGLGGRAFPLNPSLYDLGRTRNSDANREVFRDVTVGNNGYPATSKWDFVTGWGSARFGQLYNDFAYRGDYAPVNPGDGWASPILVSTDSASAFEPVYFDNTTTYYIGYAFTNNGPADGRGQVSRLSIDGTNYSTTNPDIGVGYSQIRFPVTYRAFPLGIHTLTVTTDVNNDVVEGDETNNSYTRIFTVRPKNDAFLRAFSISGGTGTTTGTNSFASIENGEPFHGGRAPSASVWWRWTAPASRFYTFDTSGSDYDTTLGAYSGFSVGSLTSLAENDDAGGKPLSSVSFLAQSGLAYRLAVDGYNSAHGNIKLNWKPAPPTNDAFANAQTLYGPTGTVLGSTLDATKESVEPAHAGNAGGNSVWFVWTAPTTDAYTWSTAGSDFDTLLGVYTGNDLHVVTTVASSDDFNGTRQSSVTFKATAGTIYHIAVDGYRDSRGGTVASGTVNLAWTNQPALSALSLSPATVVGGKENATGTVTLSAPAPSTGTSIALKSSSSAITFSASSVSASAGQTSITFKAYSHAVTAATSVTVTATLGGASKTATVTVTPVPVTVTGLSLSPTIVTGGTQNTTGTVTISAPAPAGGTTVALSSNSSAVTFRSPTLTVPAGATSATFRAYSHAVSTQTYVTLGATAGGVTKKAVLTVNPSNAPPATLSALSFNPTSVVGGSANTTGTITLSAAAPAGGAVVSLSSSSKAITFASSTVTVAAGATTATFRAYSHKVTSNTGVTVTASLDGISKTAGILVRP